MNGTETYFINIIRKFCQSLLDSYINFNIRNIISDKLNNRINKNKEFYACSKGGWNENANC